MDNKKESGNLWIFNLIDTTLVPKKIIPHWWKAEVGGADSEMQCKKVGMMIGPNCKTNLGKKVRQEYWSLQKKFNGITWYWADQFFLGANNVW